MDLESMLDKLDDGDYETTDAFMADIRLIVNNALTYNPSRGKTSLKERCMPFILLYLLA